MRDTWYADKHDLVKWGTLVHLAERESLQLIVQVSFLRRGDRPPLHARNKEIDISPVVWDFFRNVRSVEALGTKTGRQIMVFDELFVPQEREKYTRAVVRRIESLQESKAVLLDPDTGIEPEKAKAGHVTVNDVQAVWRALRPGDWLVLYQHAARGGGDWRTRACCKLTAACDRLEVEVLSAPGISADVAFLATRKT